MKKLLILLMLLSFNIHAKPVDINKASAQEISDSLNGVGMKKAEAIVNYRKKHGSFKSMNGLINVKGIGEKTLAKNKANIKVNMRGLGKKAKPAMKKAQKKMGNFLK